MENLAPASRAAGPPCNSLFPTPTYHLHQKRGLGKEMWRTLRPSEAIEACGDLEACAKLGRAMVGAWGYWRNRVPPSPRFLNAGRPANEPDGPGVSSRLPHSDGFHGPEAWLADAEAWTGKESLEHSCVGGRRPPYARTDIRGIGGVGIHQDEAVRRQFCGIMFFGGI
jgi:hypothetical protein